MKKLLALLALSAVLVVAALSVQGGRGAQACCPPPANDNFNNATVVNSLPYDNKVDSTYALNEGNDPSISCKRGYGHSVWYQYTPASDQKASMNTNGSGASDTILAVFTGSKGALTEVACDDDSGTGFRSALSVALNAGTTYHILVATWLSGSGGNLRLHIGLAPANDHFNDGTKVVSLPFDDKVDSTEATDEGNDPSACASYSHSVWYRYTPPSTRTVDVTTSGSGVDDTILAVFTGNKGALDGVACNDDISFSDQHSAIKLTLTGGTTYYFLAASFGEEDGGNLRLLITSQHDEEAIEPPFATSNFKCYQARLAKRSVRFQRQTIFTFDPNLRIRAETTVTGLSLYCNPAKQELPKQTGGIEERRPVFEDPDVPFKDFRETCYAARDQVLGPGDRRVAGRHVFAQNKFGDLKLTLGRLESVCVLALKTSGQLPDYGDLEGQILKCYSARPVKGSPRFEAQRVGLADQFDQDGKEATVLRPVSYCTFAGKSNEPDCIVGDCKCLPGCVNGGGNGLEPPLPFRAAVVCYSLRQPSFRAFDIPVIDQFIDQQFVDPLITIKKADRLCVPSEKKYPFAENDDFSNPWPVQFSKLCLRKKAVCPFEAHEVTMNATSARNDPDIVHCESVADDGVEYGHSVWFTYTPTDSFEQNVWIHTLGSSYDTVLAVYHGEKGHLTQIACSDDVKGTISKLDLQLQQKTYYIMVGAVDSSPGGKLKLTVLPGGD